MIAASGRPFAIALADEHDVRDDPGMLEGPHPAGPPVAGLDLVGDEQDAVPVGERPQAPQERGRRRDVAALALDGLDEERGHVCEGGTTSARSRSRCSSEAAVAASSSPPNSRYAAGNGAMWTAGSSGS